MHRVIILALLLSFSVSLSCRKPAEKLTPSAAAIGAGCAGDTTNHKGNAIDHKGNATSHATDATYTAGAGVAARPEELAPLDWRRVDLAIEMGKKSLYASQLPNGSWPGYGKNPGTGKVQYPVGPTALAVLSLLESGESAQTPKMKKALEWLATNKATKTYELGLRCNVWMIARSQSGDKFRKQLDSDAKMLEKSASLGSYGADSTGIPSGGDSANSLYGLWGVAAAGRGYTYEISDNYWQNVLKHWTDAQNADGGWGYSKGQPSTATMTLAGVTCLQVCFDYRYSAKFIKCTGDPAFKPIDQGLVWLDKNIPKELAAYAKGGDPARTFPPGYKPGDIFPDLPASGDLYHFLWNLQRAGLLTGRKNFGGVDWYHAGAGLLLARMQKNGGWTGGIGGPDISTAYALGFLVHGRTPVVFNKLQFPSLDDRGNTVTTDWNCRPRDMAMLTGWMSRCFEQSLNWQIVGLDMPVSQWHGAPVLYIAGSLAPSLTDKDIEKLRQYVLHGGTIFSCTEGSDATKGFGPAIRKVYMKMLPEYEMVEVPPDHPIFGKKMGVRLQGKPKLFMISNDMRPLVIHTDEDLPKSWQLNRVGSAQANFQIAYNIFMYFTDKGKLRNRGSFAWPVEVKLPAPKAAVQIVRLKWSGNWNPEPLALERFSRLLAMQTGCKCTVAAPVAVADVAKSGAQFAVLSGQGEIRLLPADVDAMKTFVQNGGTILIDAAGGDKVFYDSVDAAMKQNLGGDFVKLDAKSEVFNLKGIEGGVIEDVAKGIKVRYRSRTLARRGAGAAFEIPAWMVKNAAGKDRPGIILSREDISCAGLVGYQCYGVDGYDPGTDVDGTAYRIMRNLVLYATVPGIADKKK